MRAECCPSSPCSVLDPVPVEEWSLAGDVTVNLRILELDLYELHRCFHALQHRALPRSLYYVHIGEVARSETADPNYVLDPLVFDL